MFCRIYIQHFFYYFDGFSFCLHKNKPIPVSVGAVYVLLSAHSSEFAMVVAVFLDCTFLSVTVHFWHYPEVGDFQIVLTQCYSDISSKPGRYFEL